MRIAVQLIAFDEPGLTDTMDAWADQSVPDHADSVSYEAWITPTERANMECPTWRQAVDHPVFEAHETPKYKLPSRNVAHDAAVSSGYDVFIACDADAPPMGGNVLTALTAPLSDPGVAAVCANPVSDRNPTGVRANIGVTLKEIVAGGIHGQTHALSAEAWRHAGPLAEDIDHTHLWTVWKEEEWRFGRRLREHGEVVYRFDAPVYNDTRRKACSWRRALRRPTQSSFCDRIYGEETFAPSAAGLPRGRGSIFYDPRRQ